MAQPRRARLVGVAVAACCLLAACQRTSADAIDIAWTIVDAPPEAGAVSLVRFVLRDASRQPIRGAMLTLEGHMSHPGMAPIATSVTETANGLYEGRLHFPMTGDWTLVVSGALRNGTRLIKQRRFEIRGGTPVS